MLCYATLCYAARGDRHVVAVEMLVLVASDEHDVDVDVGAI